MVAASRRAGDARGARGRTARRHSRAARLSFGDAYEGIWTASTRRLSAPTWNRAWARIERARRVRAAAGLTLERRPTCSRVTAQASRRSPFPPSWSGGPATCSSTSAGPTGCATRSPRGDPGRHDRRGQAAVPRGAGRRPGAASGAALGRRAGGSAPGQGVSRIPGEGPDLQFTKVQRLLRAGSQGATSASGPRWRQLARADDRADGLHLAVHDVQHEHVGETAAGVHAQPARLPVHLGRADSERPAGSAGPARPAAGRRGPGR